MLTTGHDKMRVTVMLTARLRWFQMPTVRAVASQASGSENRDQVQEQVGALLGGNGVDEQ